MLTHVLELVVDASQKDLDDALVAALTHHQLESVRALLDHGADVNHELELGRRPLSFAKTGELVSLLLERGADVTTRDAAGLDLLHQYLDHRSRPARPDRLDVAVIERLIAAGLDVRARNADHSHAHFACGTQHLGVLECVLKAGADPNGPHPKDAGSVLTEATYGEFCVERLALCVKYGLDPNAQIAPYTTLLCEVCKLGDIALATTLLDLGAEVNPKVISNPLARAQESRCQPLFDLLLERGARRPQRAIDPTLVRALDLAERDAPHDRLAFANALVAAGYFAAGAREFQAAGIAVPDFTRGGVQWSFVPFEETQSISPRVDDPWFPRARVTDGSRIVPLVLTFGVPCSRCDEKGEVTCAKCNGTGWYAGFAAPIPVDDDVRCEPRASCPVCEGSKFEVSRWRLGHGSCRHQNVSQEGKVGPAPRSVIRCTACGLAALDDVHFPFFACAVCGHFVCRCQ